MQFHDYGVTLGMNWLNVGLLSSSYVDKRFLYVVWYFLGHGTEDDAFFYFINYESFIENFKIILNNLCKEGVVWLEFEPT